MLEGMGVEGMQGEGSLDILPREENVGERAGLARLALLGEREADRLEKRRSTVADVAGQLRYCRAMAARLGKMSSYLVLLSPLQSAHHSSVFRAVFSI